VPKDLKLAEKQEQFTITVTYETLELYGKVQATRRFTIAAD
jgi:hypothetical protein